MESKKTRGIVLQTIGIVGFALGGVVFTFLSWFFIAHSQSLSTDIGDWASFGDYFGGLMNPVVAGAALFLLARSLIVQQQELSETRKALADSSKSQAEQAETALKQSRIEIVKMIYQKVNIELEAELAYRNTLIEKGVENGRIQQILCDDGSAVDARKLIAESANKITEMKGAQDIAIEEAQRIINQE